MPAASAPSPQDSQAELIAFLADRSAPCPRCAYDLRAIKSAQCPECGEPLILKVGSPRINFGWLVLAMAPGCFSGIAALFVLIPIVGSLGRQMTSNQDLPWPVVVADAFGFLSAGSVFLMYRHRHRIMAWPARRQATLAGSVWVTHVAMFAILLTAIILWF